MAQVRKIEDAAQSAANTSPSVVDLGRKKKKLIKRLRKGEGRLADDAHQLLLEMQQGGSVGANAQAIIVVVAERPRKRRGMFGR